MKDFLESLKLVWDWLSSLPRLAQAVAVAAIIAIAAEAAQSNYIGKAMFWVAAPVVPWPQLIEPTPSTTAAYSIQRPNENQDATLTSRSPCPISSELKLAYSRSSEGWALVAGWNAKEGIYPLQQDSETPTRVEKDTTYTASWSMTSSADREVFFVLTSSKPFSVKEVLDEVSRELADSVGKGAEPTIEGIMVGNVSVTGPVICIS